MTLEIIAQVLKCPHCSIEWDKDMGMYRIIRTDAEGKEVAITGKTLIEVTDVYWNYLRLRARGI